MQSNKTHEQGYKIIKQEKEFEIRFYPAAIMAAISTPANTYSQLGKAGFPKLAAYIFGGNATRERIAMTKPVHMDINDTSSTMSFVMPSMYNINNLPRPNNAEVVIKRSDDEHVAAVTFSGFASEADIKQYTVKLQAALKTYAIDYYGTFRFLGYNPPYQLVGRKNEIIVGVNWPPK